MTRTITSVIDQNRFDQIIDSAVDHNDRFLVERAGEPAVLILSIADFVKTLAPAPDWLRDIQEDARIYRLDKLAMDDIELEIAAARGERRKKEPQSGA